MDLSTRANAVEQTLLEVYGIPAWRDPLPAVDELVSTILSQNTNDNNRDRAYTALRQNFPTWEMVRDASTDEVIEAIRPAGLANQKGPRIQETLRSITVQRGSLDLSFLVELPVAEARLWLMQFKGVGPKTAAIVLLFSLGKPAFPVDTHIYRVTGRLGLRPMAMSVEDAHEHLEKLFTADMYGPMHLNIIRLGRQVCQARKPNCASCPVSHLCDFNSKRQNS
jgi:endonuclease III